MSYKPGAHLDDLIFIQCPLCNKDMVHGRWHNCKAILESDQYLNLTTKVILRWKPSVGWGFYCKGDFKGFLSFQRVVNIVKKNPDWVSTGVWKPPEAVKNIY